MAQTRGIRYGNPGRADQGEHQVEAGQVVAAQDRLGQDVPVPASRNRSRSRSRSRREQEQRVPAKAAPVSTSGSRRAAASMNASGTEHKASQQAAAGVQASADAATEALR
jgi:hypothetical protein